MKGDLAFLKGVSVHWVISSFVYEEAGGGGEGASVRMGGFGWNAGGGIIGARGLGRGRGVG